MYAQLPVYDQSLRMGEFPAVILWVVYTGRDHWDGPSDIRDMFGSDQLKWLGVEASWPIICSNLTETPLNELPETAGLRAGLMTLTSRAFDHEEVFAGVEDDNRLLLSQLASCIWTKQLGERIKTLPAPLLAKIGEREDSMRMIVEDLMLQGKANIIIRLLEQRFGPLAAPTKQRIFSTGIEQLDAESFGYWTDAKSVD